jgi:predicted kinase
MVGRKPGQRSKERGSVKRSASGMSAVISGGLPNGWACGGNRVAWCRASRASVQDVPVVAVLVGLQASGKTTFCRDVLGERYVQVSKDHFPNARNRQQRQLRLVRAALAAGRDVVIDNTNPSPAEWQPLIETARECGAGVVAYWFPPDLTGSLARNAARAGRARVPEVGIMSTVSRLRQPATADGFDSVLAVRFDGSGGFEVIPCPAGVAGGC